jgi:hypothetical protein
MESPSNPGRFNRSLCHALCDVTLKSRTERFSELLRPFLFDLVVSLQVGVAKFNTSRFSMREPILCALRNHIALHLTEYRKQTNHRFGDKVGFPGIAMVA